MATVNKERIVEKRKKAAEKFFSTKEPSVDVLDYENSLGRALNWYSVNADYKQRKQWLLSYLKVRNRTKEAQKIASVKKDYLFYTVGVLCRLVDRDQYLSEKHLALIQATIQKIVNADSSYKDEENLVDEDSGTTSPVETKPKKVVSLVNTVEAAAAKIGADFDQFIDKYIDDGCPANIQFIIPENTAPAVLKKLREWYEPLRAEIAEAYSGTCEQLNEGYDFLKRVQLKRYNALLDSFMERCETLSKRKVVTRTLRKRKEKPPAVLVAKMNYLKEDANLKLDSINPADIIGKSELWVYNVKYKKLTVYRSLSDCNLTVKGSTLLNFDVDNSESKTIGRNLDFLPRIDNDTKRELNSSWKKLNAKSSVPNGRINKDTLLLRVF
jgi:hypothetical protein